MNNLLTDLLHHVSLTIFFQISVFSIWLFHNLHIRLFSIWLKLWLVKNSSKNLNPPLIGRRKWSVWKREILKNDFVPVQDKWCKWSAIEQLESWKNWKLEELFKSWKNYLYLPVDQIPFVQNSVSNCLQYANFTIFQTLNQQVIDVSFFLLTVSIRFQLFI